MSSYSFEHLKPTAQTREYPINFEWPFSTEPAVFTVRHAGDSNTAYVNARARLASSVSNPGALTPAELLSQFIPLYARHVIVGWRNVFDSDGKQAAHSVEEAEKLLTALGQARPDLLDGLIAFARNPDNFRARLDAVSVGKE